MSRPLTGRLLAVQVAASVGVLVVVVLVCCLVGTQRVDIGRVLDGPGPAGSPNLDYEIVVRIRLPRVLLAGVVGMALSCAGAVFQALLRNPLADPYILGISSGAGLGAAVAVMVPGIAAWSLDGVIGPVTCLAFAGALATVGLVSAIGRVAGGGGTTSLLLAGVVVNAFLSAVILFLISVAGGHQLQTTIFWLMGHLNTAALEEGRAIGLAALIVVAGAVVLFRLGPALNVLSFGHSDAQTVGVHVKAVHRTALGVASLVTAVAVSFSGLVGFVGLVVPHAVRLVFGPDHRRLIPLAGLYGAAFLIVADTFARVVVAPAELPVGVVTAMVGGPFFLVLLVRYARGHRWGQG